MAIRSKSKTFSYAFVVLLAFALSGLAVGTAVVGSAAEADEETSDCEEPGGHGERRTRRDFEKSRPYR